MADQDPYAKQLKEVHLSVANGLQAELLLEASAANKQNKRKGACELKESDDQHGIACTHQSA